MYVVLITVIVGAIIGFYTNSLAIKMLFRPLKPWFIGNWQVPFTPGLIPKRKDEIAESLGQLVEKYLFTAKGVKQFIEDSGFKEKLYLKMVEKIEKYIQTDVTIGEIVSTYVNNNWQDDLKQIGENKVIEVLNRQNIRTSTLKDLLNEDSLEQIEQKIGSLTPLIINELKLYLNSIEGRRWIEGLLKQSLEGKKMLGFLAMFLDGNQLQEKIITYLEQLLEQETTIDGIKKMIIKEWNKIKETPLENLLAVFDETLIFEARTLLDRIINELAQASIGGILRHFEKKNVYEKLYNLGIDLLLARLDSIFNYLSISKVVKDEVSQFSLIELERMLLEISGRELKMITYFGGILGGMIGFFQGILYLFF